MYNHNIKSPTYRKHYVYNVFLKSIQKSIHCSKCDSIEPFTINAVLHSPGTFASGNNTLSRKVTSHNN